MADQLFLLDLGNNEQIPVFYRINMRARRIILRIEPKTHRFIVTLPSPVYRSKAIQFVKDRSAWVEQKRMEWPKARPFIDGAHIPFRGALCQLSYRSGQIGTNWDTGSPMTLYIGGREDRFSQTVSKFLRKAALEDLNTACIRFSHALGVHFQTIRIKDTRTRWGSCTDRGIMNFSWRLVCAPPYVLEYVAAHECAHLIEMNHGDQFWKLVEKLVGDSNPARNWLRQNGHILHRLGEEVIG